MAQSTQLHTAAKYRHLDICRFIIEKIGKTILPTILDLLFLNRLPVWQFGCMKTHY